MYYNTITANMCTPVNNENTGKKITKRRKRKHIPHAQRSSEYVEKRNKRERTRIRAVNEAFERLRERVPSCAQDPDLRISKMEILTHAIGYIEGLCGSLGYRDFAEYCRWEGQRTVPGRGKENPRQELQVRVSSICNLCCPHNVVLQISTLNVRHCTIVLRFFSPSYMYSHAYQE